MKPYYLGLLSLMLLLSADGYAQCSRADVDYFLKKGFSQDQVTAICQISPDQKKSDTRYKAYGGEVGRAAREQQAYRDKEDERRFLQSAISGWDVRITPKRLEYTHKICLSSGSNPDVTARLKVCPEVKYRIYFKGLKIKGAERRYLAFGRREIEVEGKVKRKLMHNFKEYGKETRQKLLAAYRARTRKGATFIPVRKDYPLQQISEILRRYVREASEAS